MFSKEAIYIILTDFYGYIKINLYNLRVVFFPLEIYF